MRLKSDLTLVFIAIVWGTAFVAQRQAAQNLGFFLFNALRFGVAALVILAVMRFRVAIPRRELPFVLLTGGVLTMGSLLQQAGMRWTTAANGGFITSLYVMLVPLTLFLFWGQKVSRRVWLAVGLAVVGAYFLSTGGTNMRISIGDGLELLGALFWAFHVILIGRSAGRLHPLPFTFGQALVAAIAQGILALFFDMGTLPALGANVWGVIYTGVFSMGMGYSLQAYAQRHAPPADAALILSTEGVFAALGGWLVLGEGLLPFQLLGCGLIFLAVLLSQFPGEWLPGRKSGAGQARPPE